MTDGAGNRLNSARRIEIRPATTTFSDYVGTGDRFDFYRVHLTNARNSFRLNLRSSGANADLELVQDRNRNGRIDRGELVASSRAIGQKPDSISLVGLPEGVYFVQVTPQGIGEVDYTLSMSARSVRQADATFAMVEFTNTLRKRYSLPALAVNTQLTAAAQNHTRQMSLRDFLSDRGLDRSTPESRIRRAGYQPRWWAENIGAGFPTIDRMAQSWLESESHRRAMLSPELQEIGVGYTFRPKDPGNVTWKSYWVQSFGTPI